MTAHSRMELGLMTKMGKDLNRSDVIREVVLDIDGKETTIRKNTKQKWRKPHGQTEEVLDGNTVSYEI